MAVEELIHCNVLGVISSYSKTMTTNSQHSNIYILCKSQNLNQIEHQYQLLKTEGREIPKQTTTKRSCSTGLGKNYKRRIDAVIAIKGYATKYCVIYFTFDCRSRIELYN